MPLASTIEPLGQYCGRFHPGFWGEPQNTLSNLAFLLAALLAFRRWRRQVERDSWPLPLFFLAGCVGVGSFIFHSHPTPHTLTADLVPIQVFGLAAIGFICLRQLKFTPARTALFLLAFFALRQIWVRSLPFLLGGGITHVPAVLVLLGLGLRLRRQASTLSGYLLSASGFYVTALFVRAWDLPLCSAWPVGLHWAWHLLTAAAAGTILLGVAANSPERSIKPQPANGMA